MGCKGLILSSKLELLMEDEMEDNAKIYLYYYYYLYLYIISTIIIYISPIIFNTRL